MTPPARGEHESRDWRGRIRPIAIVVFRREDGRILVAPGFDTVKKQRFYRPLGGEIEFGELAEDTARREILEETGAEVDGLRLLGVFENIFTFLGSEGHELVWAFEAEFSDPSYYEGDVVVCDESGAAFEAHWVPMSIFEEGEAPLYPDGLLETMHSNQKPYHGGTMGMTFVEIDVGNVAAPQQSETVRFLVDSGATYSVVPAEVLARLGIEPLTEQEFNLANSSKISRKKGGALFRMGTRVGVADVIFGDPGDATLLGAFTLVALGLALDPLRRELRELPMLLAQQLPLEQP